MEDTRVTVTGSVRHTFPDFSDIKGMGDEMSITKSWESVCLF